MKIVGFDYPCMDMNILCPHMPAEEELVEMRDISLMGGGKVANAIIAAARLGARTAFIGAVGEDRYGKLCIEDMRMHGVDVENIKIRQGNTSLCISLVDEENRGKHYIESAATIKRLSCDELPFEIFDEGDYLMLYQFDEAAGKLAEFVHGLGGYVVADGDEYDERLEKNLADIDIFIMSEYYYRHLFPSSDHEKNLKAVSQKGPSIVVATLGSKGCIGIDHGIFFRIEAFEVKAADTTGAGDVFHGAFTKGISEGMSGREAARYAGAVSAIKCTILGGRTGIPTEECVNHFMETGEILPADFRERENRYREDVWR